MLPLEKKTYALVIPAREKKGRKKAAAVILGGHCVELQKINKMRSRF